MTWDEHLNLWRPDPRDTRCARWDAKANHAYRIGALYPDGKARCIRCGRERGRRYAKPRD